MPLFPGLKNVDHIYFGGKNVVKIYFGQKVVYEEGVLYSSDNKALADTNGLILEPSTETNFTLADGKTMYTADGLIFSVLEN